MTDFCLIISQNLKNKRTLYKLKRIVMSVLLEFAMFPTDRGSSSVSNYVSQVIDMIRNECASYKLTAMGTIIETENLEDALAIVQKAYKVLEPHSDRVYSSIKLDIRKNKSDRLNGKIKSIEDKIGEVEK
jgi:uncharacterized protein (TIGR00106 family)